jgi:hypothetical protein
MVYKILFPAFPNGLKQLTTLLDEGKNYSDSKNFEFDILLQSRLAPDQFPLIKQVQIACDTAKLGVARLIGKEAPIHDDTEKNLDDLKNRILSVNKFITSFSKSEFDGAENRKIKTPRWGEKFLTGENYLSHHVVPNFYFHLTTAYSILRHNGVGIGKKNYLGEMPFETE